MIRSMTGFGLATAEDEGTHYVVEIRSLNNKYFKAQLRIPDELQGIEAEFDSTLRKTLNRGSVVLTVLYSDISENAAAQINTAVVDNYLKQLLKIEGLANGKANVDLSAILNLPGVVIRNTGEDRLERARPVLLKLLEEASEKVLIMRSREGKSLHDDLHKNRDIIFDRLAVVESRAPKVVEEYQARLKLRVDELLKDAGSKVRDEDLVREVAVYAEKSDIAEEITRLSGHLSHFAEIIDADDKEPAGRTLDFLTQEMLREANTIASKSSDSEISRLIVEIKGAIDRIREQVQNVE